MRIGFLMGSFDPIHVGHINMIRVALNSKSVDKVVVVVSGHNPWKKTPPINFKDRVEMCRMATIQFGDKCEVSDIEETFEPPYTANKPLNYFREFYTTYGDNDELFIIAGADTAPKIPRWKNAKAEILPYYGVICISRPGSKEDNMPLDVFKEFIPITPDILMDVSSTAIRKTINEGNILYPLVPAEVENYINDKHLYTDEEDF